MYLNTHFLISLRGFSPALSFPLLFHSKAELCLQYFDKTPGRGPRPIDRPRPRSGIWEKGKLQKFGEGPPGIAEGLQQEYNIHMQRYRCSTDMGLLTHCLNDLGDTSIDE